MTDNPCKGLTKAQTNAFVLIGIDFFPSCSKATLQKLIDRGLVVRRKKLTHLHSSDYFVPRSIFNRWLKWTNERFGD